MSKNVGENCMLWFHKQETEWFSKFGNNVHHVHWHSKVAGRRNFTCYFKLLLVSTREQIVFHTHPQTKLNCLPLK